MDRAELQAMQLAMAMCLGLGLGFFYDVYRVWFRRVKLRWLAGAGDIIWWGLALLLAMGGLYRINGLELRFPVLALTVAGVCVYMGLLSPVIFPLLWRLLGGLWRVIKWLGGCFAGALGLLLCPLVWLVELAFGLGQLGVQFGRAGARLLGRILGIILRPFYGLAASFKKHLKKVDFNVDFSKENDI